MESCALPTWPYYGDDEVEAVAAVLRSGNVNYWTGEDVSEFEAEFAAYTGAAHAVALANGTLALEAGLRGLGLQPGDEVIVPSRTFIASASSVALLGGVPVFADVDRQSQTLDPNSVSSLIGPRTVGIVAVHLAGWPCDMTVLTRIARQHQLWILEDCAQAHGAVLSGRKVGSLGDAAAFSFCQDKIMSTGGEGGMLVTNDRAVWEAAWSYKDHGKSYAAVQAARTANGPFFRWVHESLGSNWRMNGMQAAIGRIQLTKLDEWQRRRTENARYLRERLDSCASVDIWEPMAHIEHAYYKFYAFVRPERLKSGCDRDTVLQLAISQGVPCGSGSCSEVYLEKAFVNHGMCPNNRLPVARELGDTSLMLPVHPTLGEEHLDFVATNLTNVLTTLSK